MIETFLDILLIMIVAFIVALGLYILILCLEQKRLEAFARKLISKFDLLSAKRSAINDLRS